MNIKSIYLIVLINSYFKKFTFCIISTQEVKEAWVWYKINIHENPNNLQLLHFWRMICIVWSLVVSHSGLVPDLLAYCWWETGIATAGLNYVGINKRCKLGLRQADFLLCLFYISDCISLKWKKEVLLFHDVL